MADDSFGPEPPRGETERTAGRGREKELLDPSVVIPRGTPAPPVESVLQLLADVFMPKASESLHQDDAWRYYMLPAQDAWWYYIDVYYRKFRPQMEELDFRAFVLRLWRYVDAGSYGTAEAAQFVDTFAKETRRIPCAGVVVLNSALDEILLVLGTWSNAKWGFPKGKLKEGEAVCEGAIRETEEEIGVNVRPFMVDGVSARHEFCGRDITLFLAVGLSTRARFVSRTRHEIAEIRWHKLAAVRAHRARYPLLVPFLKLIDEWIDNLKNQPEPTSGAASVPPAPAPAATSLLPAPVPTVAAVPAAPAAYQVVFSTPQPAQPQPVQTGYDVVYAPQAVLSTVPYECAPAPSLLPAPVPTSTSPGWVPYDAQQILLIPPYPQQGTEQQPQQVLYYTPQVPQVQQQQQQQWWQPQMQAPQYRL